MNPSSKINNQVCQTFALQKSGELTEDSLKYINSLGYRLEVVNKLLLKDINKNTNFLLIRNSDIPNLVANRKIDLGIVGLDQIEESGFNFTFKKPLNFGYCELKIGIPKDQLKEYKNLRGFRGKRVATSYPNLVFSYFKRFKIEVKPVFMRGSVELAPKFGIADLIADVVVSGNTMKSMDLVPNRSIFSSQAYLISNTVNKQ